MTVMSGNFMLVFFRENHFILQRELKGARLQYCLGAMHG
jgi:hypothetical protein